MKTLTLLLLTAIASAQSFTFYTGTSKSFGSEIMFNDSYGFGFAGTNEGIRASGRWSPGNISEWDMQYVTGTITQKWCTAYGLVSFGYFRGVQVSYLLGGALYARKMNFEYNGDKYHKDDSIFLKPILGIDFSKEITKDVGIKIGFDTFNKIKLGINVYF